jgi:cytochrome c2
MGKPVERQNHSVSFFILATLIAVCTAWAFYDEFLGRRPWRSFQERIFNLERERAADEMRYYQRKLESGDIKVVLDPSKPGPSTTVAEAQKRLEEIDHNLAKERDELDRIRGELKNVEIEAADADLKVKLLKSEDDGLFYIFQHAEHEEANTRAKANKLRAEGKRSETEAEEKLAEDYRKKKEEAERERERLAQQIKKAEEEAEQATNKLAGVQNKLKAKVGERDRIKAAIEAAKDPLLTAKAGSELAARKSPELTQYWLTTFDNSVDRCQNCHALIDKCGYSRPHEIVEALAAPNAKPEEVGVKYCINPERQEHYQQTAAEVCAIAFDRQASKKGELSSGRCLDKERPGVADFLTNYCGPQAPAVKVLRDRDLKAACLSQEDWQKLAQYVEPIDKRGACAIEIKPAGDVCVEGARREQLLSTVRQQCPEVSSTLKGLEKNAKACASGEGGKKLDSIKPVLYNYEVWAQSHPSRGELLGSNHPADRFGCTTCHEGQGAQTKGVAGREFHHGYDDYYWEKPMLDLVAHKKYRPLSWSAPSEKQGVPGEWVQHEREFVESTCAKCHAEEVELKFADTYTKGRRLTGEVGCPGCHPIDAFRDFPKIGPTLTDLKKKTTPAFLVSWISYPKSFRPRTKMPNFWPEALSIERTVRQGSPEAATRAGEVQKIVAYLWKNSEPPDLPPLPVAGDGARGKLLVQKAGCRGCHTFVPPDKLCTPEQIAAGKTRGTPQEPGECEAPRTLSGSDARDFAPNLSNIGHKTNERWLFAWLKNPSSMWPQTRMPNLRLSNQEAADITAYLLTLKSGTPPPAQLFFQKDSPELIAAAAEGDKLVVKYGCPGCHDVKGHENDAKIGADLNEFGRKAVDLLDFGNAIPNPRHYSWYNWIDLKLRAPRAYRYERVDTRMPQFDFNDDEVDSIMTFLKSRSLEKIPPQFLASNERRLAISRGDQVIDYFNCRGCHTIDFQGGAIRDIFAEDDLWKAPPLLQQEGWRVQPDWLFGFLGDPSKKLRPWLDVRMPTFPLTDERATTLVRAFAARANVPYPYISVRVPEMNAKELAEAKAMVYDQLKCFSCHTAGAPGSDKDPASLAPNLELSKHRLRPDWVLAWLKNPQSLQEGTRMPNFFTPETPDTVMYPKYFGGSQERQIRALRDFVMTLPDTGVSKPQVSTKKSPPKKKRAEAPNRAPNAG